MSWFSPTWYRCPKCEEKVWSIGLLKGTTCLKCQDILGPIGRMVGAVSNEVVLSEDPSFFNDDDLARRNLPRRATAGRLIAKSVHNSNSNSDQKETIRSRSRSRIRSDMLLRSFKVLQFSRGRSAGELIIANSSSETISDLEHLIYSMQPPTTWGEERVNALKKSISGAAVGAAVIGGVSGGALALALAGACTVAVRYDAFDKSRKIRKKSKSAKSKHAGRWVEVEGEGEGEGEGGSLTDFDVPPLAAVQIKGLSPWAIPKCHAGRPPIAAMSTYEAIKSKIRSGSIYMHHGFHAISYAIEIFTESYFSHCGMFIRDEKNELWFWSSDDTEELVNEDGETYSVKPGANLFKADDVVRAHRLEMENSGVDDEYVCAFRTLQRVKSKVVSYKNFKSKVLRKYDGLPFPPFPKFLGDYAKGKLFNWEADETTVFCSQLLTKSLRSLGLNLLPSDGVANSYSPEDFCALEHGNLSKVTWFNLR